MKGLALALCLPFFSFAHETAPTPWLTGPLLAPTGTVTPLGDFNIQVYGYFTEKFGSYGSDWQTISSQPFFSFNQQIVTYTGLTPWMDFTLIAQYFVNSTRGKTQCRFGDLTAGFDFQLYSADAHPWFPGVKFGLSEVFPTGAYQNLSPSNFGTDNVGLGTFGTSFNLVFYKVYHFTGPYYMSLTLSGSYQLNTPVRVHGLNAYGGVAGTDGTVHAGNEFQGILSFEFTLSQNWVFALDNVYSHHNASPFSGVLGIGSLSTEQLSFAPAIEYNFSSQLGVIAGCWFTAMGRNSPWFASGVAELNYYY